MIICISGLTGSGKTTIGDKIADDLKIVHVNKTHKGLVSKPGDTLQFTKDNTSPSFEKNFDDMVVDEAHKQNSVVTSWLSPWFIKDATARVWLFADFEDRVQRKMQELNNPNIAEVRAYITEKDSFNVKNWKKIYNIDINDHSIFDIEINTSKLNVNQTVAQISLLSLQKEAKERK